MSATGERRYRLGLVLVLCTSLLAVVVIVAAVTLLLVAHMVGAL